MTSSPVYIVMGVSGSGKSTFGSLLAGRLHLPFIEADDPQFGGALRAVSARLSELEDGGAVAAAAALRERDRAELASELKGEPVFIYLQGDFDTAAAQTADRGSSGATQQQLFEQFDLLEEPEQALYIPLSEHLNFADEVDAVVERQKLYRR